MGAASLWALAMPLGPTDSLAGALARWGSHCPALPVPSAPFLGPSSQQCLAFAQQETGLHCPTIRARPSPCPLIRGDVALRARGSYPGGSPEHPLCHLSSGPRYRMHGDGPPLLHSLAPSSGSRTEHQYRIVEEPTEAGTRPALQRLPCPFLPPAPLLLIFCHRHLLLRQPQ